MVKQKGNTYKKGCADASVMSIPRLRVNAAVKQIMLLQAEASEDSLRSFNESEISVRLDKIEELYRTFDNFQSIIEEENPIEIEGDARSEFDRIYMSAKAAFAEELNSRRNNCNSHPAISSVRPDNTFYSPQRARLPTLEIPSFNGRHIDWPNFYATFQSIVNNDADLTNVEKFQHLRSCLKGAALDTIKSLDINEGNYAKALDLLLKRFNNKRLNFQAHIRELFSLQTVGVDWSLRQLSDTSKSHLRALESMATKEELADGLLVHLLGKKMDTASQTKWEEDTPIDVIPQWSLMENFMERRCQMLENVENAMVKSIPSKQVCKFAQKLGNRKSAYISSAPQPKHCMLCNSNDHLIYHCSHFNELPPSSRYKEAKRLHLCLNCLRPGHGARACKSTNCRTCSARHHTLLHLGSTSVPYNSIASCSSSANAEPQVTANSQHISAPSSLNAQPFGYSNAASSAAPDTHPIASTSFKANKFGYGNSTIGNPNNHSALISMSSMDTQSHSSKYSSNNYVLLGTAIIHVKDICGTLVPCRAILDSASQLNFITTKFANQLRLKKTKSTTLISGIGQSDVVSDSTVQLCIQSQHGNFNTSISAVVSHRITDHQPNFPLKTSDWNIPKNIKLADQSFDKPQRIDILLGAGLFYDLMCVGQIRLGPNLPLLQKTKLGWIICGGGQYSACNATCLTTSRKSELPHDPELDLTSLVRKFWEVETCLPQSNQFTKEEALCEEHFLKHHSRLVDGTYSVRLPTKTHPSQLGNSFNTALYRFKSLEKRLQADKNLKSQYSAFIKEYLDLGHMSLVTNPSSGMPTYFLPHHCVHKSDSTTTKLRVVFDGSAATSNGISLNDVLMAGPTIQPKLCDILLRFRTFKIALIADICKMYRCVKVSPPDDLLQCILWREHSHEPIQTFKLNTVTYGTKSAAFLAIRTMHQLSNDEELNYPLGASIVRRDFYVDDLISGGNSVDEVRQIMSQTRDLLNKGNFALRKWCSNNTQVLSDIGDAHKEEFLTFHDGTNVTKTLGLVWNPRKDTFLFAFVAFPQPAKPTKRSILSTIARFYDPLGLIGPIITKAKIFHQQLWKMKYDWDESLPQSLQTEWLDYCSDFKIVDTIQFPRLVLIPNAKLELHGFCDASLSAYGACIYIRSEFQGHINTALLCSKSRVSPLQTLSIPRLELLAANLLAELSISIANLNLFEAEYHCWSDSTVVLSWLRDEPSRYNIFVSNRISNIQTLTKDMTWHHVPSKMNPADVLSKGTTPHDLKDFSLWFQGPTFLQGDSTSWPLIPEVLSESPERRKAVCIASPKFVDFSLDLKYANSFSRMQRIFAYIYKFCSKNKLPPGSLTTSDIINGTNLLLRMIQRVAFQAEYKALESKKPVNHSSSLHSLMPFLDRFGLIRVGGRLQHSTLHFEARHPIILPKGHPISNAIINYFHCKLLHAGSQALLASIRLQYWPIGGRKYVNSIVSKCVRCFHVKPRIIEHVMGNLPEERVHSSRAFLTTGVDFCGPFLYNSEVRGRAPVKSYICLFICFATKAIHMELVRDLTTQSFLAALQRFICTRGRPKTIWSDNATNFVGAKNELAELKMLFVNSSHIKAIEDQCLQDGINWKFIPPRSPHFGGLWEAAVKTAKHHFYREVGNYTFKFDELRTLICQISAIINSRPLCPITENPDDLEVLTPAHFLIGAPFTSYAEPDVTELNLDRLTRWQRVCYVQQIFWKKWSTEYLTLLQERAKWRYPLHNLEVGSMVLLKDDNLPPLKWQLGRVVDTTPGDDGVVRVATVRTSRGTTKRAVRNLCALPIDAVGSHDLPTGGVC